ncbi:MAG TPA: prepilin-type N-terminal cleavage/methylation domain-containing protein [Thermoanaerobaculia bacterium]|nr:prepilin-type N-terminal cleavage/methylation domain-containing protein [Thermoanaerobaculia bacterium]
MLQEKTFRRHSGFSLLEVLIVIAIIAAVSLVAAPWFARISQRSKLRSAAREVHATLLAARMTAVRSGIPASVRITPAVSGTSHHSVETWLEATPARRLKEFRLPTQFQFVTLPPGNDVVFTADGRRNPPGTAREDIVIEGLVGSALSNRITLEAYENGRVAFVPPTEWR